MKQSKKASLTETVLNTALGLVVAILTQSIVFPLFGIHIEMRENLAIGTIFTGVSIARGFCVRRLFEHLRVARVLK